MAANHYKQKLISKNAECNIYRPFTADAIIYNHPFNVIWPQSTSPAFNRQDGTTQALVLV